jgi:hypothetical protein
VRATGKSVVFALDHPTPKDITSLCANVDFDHRDQYREL